MREVAMSVHKRLILHLFNESADSVHKTGLKDSFMNQTDPGLKFSSLESSIISE